MRDWTDLDRELDAWGDAGQVATFWWRDDDAVVPTPPLFRLLETRAQARVPIALAVIPRDTGEPLAQRLNGDDQVAVLLHGFSHRNHAPDE
ncbi:MAG: polysaccharide deacetylase, partial [Rhodobacterales bacterium]|nr:polysaccharide deacetylase [Rhodobacterales bacterium]